MTLEKILEEHRNHSESCPVHQLISALADDRQCLDLTEQISIFADSTLSGVRQLVATTLDLPGNTEIKPTEAFATIRGKRIWAEGLLIYTHQLTGENK